MIIIKINKTEAEFLRSKGIFVPMYNRTHKKKYLAVEDKNTLRLLEEFRKSKIIATYE